MKRAARLGWYHFFLVFDKKLLTPSFTRATLASSGRNTKAMIKKMINRKNIMTAAWEIARKAAAKFGGKVREFFSFALSQAWEAVKTMKSIPTVTIAQGNKEVTVSVVGETEWVGGEHKRAYFEFKVVGKYAPIYKMYRVISGAVTGRDIAVEVNGTTYGYVVGSACDSNTKRAAVRDAVAALAKQM